MGDLRATRQSSPRVAKGMPNSSSWSTSSIFRRDFSSQTTSPRHYYIPTAESRSRVALYRSRRRWYVKERSSATRHTMAIAFGSASVTALKAARAFPADMSKCTGRFVECVERLSWVARPGMPIQRDWSKLGLMGEQREVKCFHGARNSAAVLISVPFCGSSDEG